MSSTTPPSAGEWELDACSQTFAEELSDSTALSDSEETGEDVTEHILVKRAANALIEDAEHRNTPSLLADEIPGWHQAEPVLQSYKERYGGYWVGGNVVLSEERVLFTPNSMNKAVQSGTLTMDIPLKTVRGVNVKGGFVTKIIEIEVGAKVAKIRCFKAEALAVQIREVMGRRA